MESQLSCGNVVDFIQWCTS